MYLCGEFLHDLRTKSARLTLLLFFIARALHLSKSSIERDTMQAARTLNTAKHKRAAIEHTAISRKTEWTVFGTPAQPMLRWSPVAVCQCPQVLMFHPAIAW
jgi:hypothetical protein